MTEEPVGILAGKPRKIIPYIPPWKAEGTYSVQMNVEAFTDRMGNRALVCTAHYKDKKNKDRECVAWVKWEEDA
ncbi:hypothetical protein [Pseudomonas phage vB_PseuGesM_254]|uniref:Uncharacterized protein n=1 Tax=Pseudomonas phage vB_PseuGesM_254 TaxID=3092638 RepID=A0AAX4G676_9CAUD|nr:hypothetical protein [Pseudomonas phage PseuGes_254]